MAKKLKFFDTEQEVIDYLTRELLDTLQDDLNNSDRSERKDLKAKIHDIESIADRLTVGTGATEGYADLLKAVRLWDRFFSTMPKGQFGKIVCDVGLMNEAFIATHRALAKATQ